MAAAAAAADVPVIVARKLVKVYQLGTPVYALRGVDLEIRAPWS